MPLEKRKIELNFNEAIDRQWLKNKPFENHWLNAYVILIPDGERFIIRSCRKFCDRLSLSLQEDIRGLYFQEGQHSIQHQHALQVYRNQGYRIDGFRNLSSTFCYKIFEPLFPSILALSTASAIENINACIAEHYLSEIPFLDEANPQMSRMFAWHFAEEIEHKSVVFDALTEISANRLLRLIGLIMSLINFTGQLYLAAFFLAWQDRSVLQIAFWRDFISFNFKHGFVGELLRSSLLYMRKGFHPNKILNDHLVFRGMETFNNL